MSASANGRPMIQTFGLTRVFSRVQPPKVAVDHVDLAVDRGIIYGLIGPNGAGKSTLVALLCTLVTPTEGTALVNGHDLRREEREVRQAIALNFGGERSFYWRLTVQQNLEFFAAIHGLGAVEAGTRVQAALERTGLWDDRRLRFGECSGGMKKRLNLARALMLDRLIYMCDEPTTGVDPDSALRIRAILRELRERGKTVLLVSHNLEEVGALADRVGLMQSGRIIHEDTPTGLRGLIAPREIAIELGPGEGPEPPPAFLADLAALPGVEAVERQDGRLLVRAQAPERAISAVVGLVSRHALPISELRVVRPGLAEVFHYLVGGSRRVKGEG
ncbi:MAG: ABC transporter ATP-binding protein [Chloroflexi bacterium]|nr:ABC transporter ATP-binding protein [Chloroflexota bacterium]